MGVLREGGSGGQTPGGRGQSILGVGSGSTCMRLHVIQAMLTKDTHEAGPVPCCWSISRVDLYSAGRGRSPGLTPGLASSKWPGDPPLLWKGDTSCMAKSGLFVLPKICSQTAYILTGAMTQCCRWSKLLVKNQRTTQMPNPTTVGTMLLHKHTSA